MNNSGYEVDTFGPVDAAERMAWMVLRSEFSILLGIGLESLILALYNRFFIK